MKTSLEWVSAIERSHIDPQLDHLQAAVTVGPVPLCVEATFFEGACTRATTFLISPCCHEPMTPATLRSVGCGACWRSYTVDGGRPSVPLRGWDGLVLARVQAVLESWFNNFTDPLTAALLFHELAAMDFVEPATHPRQIINVDWPLAFSALSAASKSS